MNNKLFARIAAAAVGVSMLSTFVFADEKEINNFPVQTVSSIKAMDEAAINLNVDLGDFSNQNQLTMMAYVVAGDTLITNLPEPASADIIALDQIGGGTGKNFGEVKILTTNLVEGKKIAVKLGGTNGDLLKALIEEGTSAEKVKITFVNGDNEPVVLEVNKGESFDLSAVEAPTLEVDSSLTDYAMVILGKKFDFVGWVDDEDNDVTSLPAVNNDITLTAKYNTNMVYGDADGDGFADDTDFFGLDWFIDNEENYDDCYFGVPIYPGITTVTGDLDGDGFADDTDFFGLDWFIDNEENYDDCYAQNPIYFINRKTAK